MATGRTVEHWMRVYVDGFDMSGQARSLKPLQIEYGEANLTALADTVKGYLRTHPQVNCGVLNAVFDNTASTGIHNALRTAGDARTVLAALGIRGAPADGDPTFGGVFEQGAYQAVDDGGALTVTLPFLGWAVDAASLLYASPWGTLLHALAAATAANTGTGHDNPTAGATTNGGYLVYQVTEGDGTATLSVDDSADNAAFSALSGATTGSINCATRQHGIVAIGNTATVRRYLRWQIALGTAATVTFAASFHRA